MSSLVPIKKMKLDEGLMLSSNKHIDDLPPENLGQILRCGLSVIDLLHCARVSRHWKWAVGEFGWTDLKKLDLEIVFEGATRRQRFRFTAEHLASLLDHVAELKKNNLTELDLNLFARIFLRSAVPRIAKTIGHFPKLVKLDIGSDFCLGDFVNFLPPSLRQIETERKFSLQTLKKLSEKCPNLEKVPFDHAKGLNMRIANTFLEKFPRLKTLRFSNLLGGKLTAIASLKELEELALWTIDCFDDNIFEAMTRECKNLQTIDFTNAASKLPEASLFHLANLPNLTHLEYLDGKRKFTDPILKAIAKRGKLEKLMVNGDELTDDSIVFLIDHCRSLVSLELCCAENITKRSLKAVIAEVHRRHGNPPRSLPTGPRDKEIFYFNIGETGIAKSEANNMARGNPWLTLGFRFDSDPRDSDSD